MKMGMAKEKWIQNRDNDDGNLKKTTTNNFNDGRKNMKAFKNAWT